MIEKLEKKAFPIINNGYVYESGMNLRDYFAAKAINVATGPVIYVGEEETEESFNDFAKYCYKVADAMLKQREL